jgi:hypothetical protein
LSEINEAGTVKSGEPLAHIVEERVIGEWLRMRRRVNRLEARLRVLRQGEAKIVNGAFPGNCAQDVGWDSLHMMGDSQEEGVDRRKRGLVALEIGNRQGERFEQILYRGGQPLMELIEDEFLQVILHRDIGVVVVVFNKMRHRRQDRLDEQVAPQVSVDGPPTRLGNKMSAYVLPSFCWQSLSNMDSKRWTLLIFKTIKTLREITFLMESIMTQSMHRFFRPCGEQPSA